MSSQPTPRGPVLAAVLAAAVAWHAHDHLAPVPDPPTAAPPRAEVARPTPAPVPAPDAAELGRLRADVDRLKAAKAEPPKVEPPASPPPPKVEVVRDETDRRRAEGLAAKVKDLEARLAKATAPDPDVEPVRWRTRRPAADGQLYESDDPDSLRPLVKAAAGRPEVRWWVRPARASYSTADVERALAESARAWSVAGVEIARASSEADANLIVWAEPMAPVWGGWTTIGGPRHIRGGGKMTMRLNASGFGGTPMRTIVMHELGHALGLHHAHRRSSIMHPSSTAAGLDAADRAAIVGLYGAAAGLAGVGDKPGCDGKGKGCNRG